MMRMYPVIIFLIVYIFTTGFTNSVNINLHVPDIGDSGTSWGLGVPRNYEVLDSFFCNRVSFWTADRLAVINGSSCIEDGDLTDFAVGVSNRTTVLSDGAGGFIVNTPQRGDTGASPIFNGLTLSGLIVNTMVEVSPTGLLINSTSIKLPERLSDPVALSSTGQLYVLTDGMLLYREPDGTIHEISGGVTHSHGTIFNDDNEITLNTSSGNFEIINTVQAGLTNNTTISTVLGKTTLCSTCDGHYSLGGKISFQSTVPSARELKFHIFHNGAIVNASGGRRTTSTTGWGDGSLGYVIVEANSNDWFDVRIQDASGSPADIKVNEFNMTINREGD